MQLEGGPGSFVDINSIKMNRDKNIECLDTPGFYENVPLTPGWRYCSQWIFMVTDGSESTARSQGHVFIKTRGVKTFNVFVSIHFEIGRAHV